MVVSCSACGEQYGVTEDVTFHRFPANKERREKWLAAVQRDEWTPAKGSMLCSKHFSPDKFVYKMSKDKIRRYLMPDTVPTIFDRTKRKSKNGPPPQLALNKNAPSSVIATTASQTLKDSKPVPSQSEETLPPETTDSSHNLSLEILAATSVAAEPLRISTSLKSARLDRGNPELVKTSAGISPPVAGSSSDFSSQTKSQKNRRSSESSNKRVERASFPKRVRQVYPGDVRLNYNDVLEVSKSWTVQSNHIKKMRNKMKALRQQNQRLEKRVTDLKSVVKFLQNRLGVNDSEAVEPCGPSDSPTASHFIPEGDQLRRFPNPLGDHDYISSLPESIRGQYKRKDAAKDWHQHSMML